jgi:hypothetical protein
LFLFLEKIKWSVLKKRGEVKFRHTFRQVFFEKKQN